MSIEVVRHSRHASDRASRKKPLKNRKRAAAVGPAVYDVSTFLMRFPSEHRPWILELYAHAVARAGWRLPSPPELNFLFETSEYARIANRVIWPAIALVRDQASWGWDTLAEVDKWFKDFKPVLQCESETPAAKIVAP